MSQWAKSATVKGATFVPLLDTLAFAPVKPNSPIIEILLIDDGGNKPAANATLAHLRTEFIGLAYKNWLDILNVTPDLQSDADVLNLTRAA